MMKACLLAVCAVPVLAWGCSSPPRPDPSQERITLDEYRARAEKGASGAPVVLLPAGTIFAIRLPFPKDLSFLSPGEEKVHLRIETPFETVEEPKVVLKTRESLQLDLERFLISRDGQHWNPLGFYLHPTFGTATQVTMTPPDGRAVGIPCWAFTDLLVMPIPRD